MISVQNLRLPLSGSKVFQILLILIAVFFSCSTSKKAGKIYKPEEKKREEVTKKPLPDKIDTIIWKVEPSKSGGKEIIIEKNKNEFKPLSQLKLTLLIPFKSSEIDTSQKNIPMSSLRFVHYYAGMKMALSEFNNSNEIPIELDVFDSGDTDDSKKILSLNQKALPQIVIGPYKSDALKYTAEWAKQNQTYLISPWISSSTITEKNPYYFQVKAGLNAHYQLINEHVRAHFPIDNVLLISKSKEESKLKLFNNLLSDPREIKEEIITEDDLAVRSEPILEKLFKSDGPTVFILPLASSRDENYIYHFLRRVISEKKNKTVYVYGLYKWLDMKSDILEYINRLNVRISISNFVIGERSEVRSFKRKYFELYREFPSEDAMEGYDLTKYLIRSLKKYGLQFYLNIDEPLDDYLETQFLFKPIYKYGTESSNEIDYYENAYIKLVEIKENKYKIIE